MKLRFLAGLAAGYVLGARAGREQYEAIVERARGLAESDRIQRLRGEVVDAAGLDVDGDASSGGSNQGGDTQAGASGVGTSTLGTPPVTAGPGGSAGTKKGAKPGRDVGLDAVADPAAGGGDIDVVLPDLEPSSAASDSPVTSAPDRNPAKPVSPPKDSDITDS